MSASLVGSEMCIRDSPRAVGLECAGRHRRLAGPGEGAPDPPAATTGSVGPGRRGCWSDAGRGDAATAVQRGPSGRLHPAAPATNEGGPRCHTLDLRPRTGKAHPGGALPRGPGDPCEGPGALLRLPDGR
eukprot:4217303-Alexandrium_andersonii.AAC.1